MSSHILRAFLCDGSGGGIPLSENAPEPALTGGSFIWHHLDVNHPSTREWLSSQIPHHDPYVIDALLAEETRPRMTEVQDGIILILRGVNLNEQADPEDMVSIRLWVQKDRVISLRRRKLKAVTDMEESIQAGKGPKDTGQFICMLMARLLRRIEPILEKLDEATDEIEDDILSSVDVSLREDIIDIRKQAIVFRRYMIPQRDAIDQLRMTSLEWITDKHRRYLQENYNHVTRYVEDLDAVRERAQIVKDELANMLSDKLNKNMYMLSVIAAIFLPLGFLTGLLGINVGGIPGSDYDLAFWIFCGFLVIIVCIQIALFKRLKWF